ncbi:MAG: hypothetical protein AAGI48_04480 [Verrucomicrobiota bacterium]
MTGSGDHAGLFAFLFGVIILVFCGIGLSLVAEKKLSLGSSKVSIEESIEKDRQEFDKLTKQKKAARRRLDEQSPSATGQDDLIDGLQNESEINLGRLSVLRSNLSTLEHELEKLSGFREQHDEKYRKQVRGAAVGTKLPELSLPRGKTYHEVVIRGFDPSGLKIQHRLGTARIPYRDLPESWKTRLHWSPDEHLATRPRVATPKEGPPATASSDPKEETLSREPEPLSDIRRDDEPSSDIDAIRLRVIRAQSVYRQATSQAAEAHRNANSSQNRSVPGSLETWGERATRLDQWVRRIRKELNQAEEELRSVRPGDPLLKRTR